MADLGIGVGVGIVVGIVANFAVWALLFRYLRPRVKFAEHIARGHPQGRATDCRFMLRNVGRRDIVDLEVMARLRIPGRDPSRAAAVSMYYVPLRMDGDRYVRLPRLAPKRCHYFWFRPSYGSLSRELMRDGVPVELRVLTVEDLLTLAPGATIRVYAFGYHGFSGARAVFESPRYSAADIRDGFFRQDDCLTVETPAQMSKRYL